MSWKLVKEVRDRRLAKPDELTTMEFFVLWIMADTYRGDGDSPLMVSISQAELMTLIGATDRTTIWRAVKGLQRKGLATRKRQGNQHSGASTYELLPGERCTDATCTACGLTSECCTGATSDKVHVAASRVHVAPEQRGCCASATLPDTDISIPMGGAPEKTRQPPTAPRCSRHRNHTRPPPHCSDCRDAHRAAIDACNDCDENGHLLGDDGLPRDAVVQCGHRAVPP